MPLLKFSSCLNEFSAHCFVLHTKAEEKADTFFHYCGFRLIPLHLCVHTCSTRVRDCGYTLDGRMVHGCSQHMLGKSQSKIHNFTLQAFLQLLVCESLCIMVIIITMT